MSRLEPLAAVHPSAGIRLEPLAAVHPSAGIRLEPLGVPLHPPAAVLRLLQGEDHGVDLLQWRHTRLLPDPLDLNVFFKSLPNSFIIATILITNYFYIQWRTGLLAVKQVILPPPPFQSIIHF